MSRDGSSRTRQGAGGYSNGYGAGGGPGGSGGGGYGGYDYGSSDRNGYGSAPDRRRDRAPEERDRRGYDDYSGSGGAGGGGYGGYGTEPSVMDRSRGQQAQAQPRARQDGYEGYGGRERERVQDMVMRERSRERPRRQERGGYGPGTKKLDDILRVIEREWDFMTDEECVPVKVALQLMDSSSLGRAYQYDGFKDTHHDLQYALQSIVNDHHQGFNSSIGTFHSIMRSITSSQAKVRELRENLIKAKDDLSTSKPEVRNMVENSQKYDTMLQTLQAIEQLQLVPEKLEARISEKRFLTAVELLSNALTRIKQPDMMEIGAMTDLRSYLGSQESSLADILVEELHNHLYLKSLYCNDRWRAYSPQKDALSSSTNPNSDRLAAGGASYGPQPRALHKFIDANDFTKPISDDSNNTRNPEADSLAYIRLLLEALHSLGHLPNAIATVNQRLPVELFKLVDKTNREVDQRHPSSLAGISRGGNHGKTIDFGLAEKDVRVAVINDLLITLYSKFEAVMEGHRVIYDVVKGISKREGAQDTAPLTNGFVEVWQLIQSEMRSLLHDYLTTSDSRNALSSAPKSLNSALSNIITGKSMRKQNQAMFKLSNTDINSSDLKDDQEDLQHILKASVPGLVSDSLRPAVSSTDNHNVSDGAATGHKLLIEPNVFNINLLLPPSLAFLNRLKEVVPPGSGIVLSTLTTFLDDFLVNVFYPSLEDTIRDLFAQTTGDIDAFQEDPQWAKISKNPIMKGTNAFLDLITAFCRMLDTLPPDQAFGQLTMDLLTSYYDKCYEWFKELVARNRSDDGEQNADMKTGARWALHEDIKPILNDVWMTKDLTKQLLMEETEVEFRVKGEAPLSSGDLITDRKAVHSLCVLSTSMKWIASKVVQLRHIEDPESFSRNDGGAAGRVRRRWTLIDDVRTRDEGRPVYLPMTAETVSAFDGVISCFRELATTIIFTLRNEARCRAIFYIHRCMAEGNYCLDSSVQSPDPNVLTLNSELIWFDEDISSALSKDEAQFTWRGLSTLVEHLLVSEAHLIKVLNKLGADRMLTNILVLQQNLKNIEKSADLDRASRFYALYNGNMDDLIADAKSGRLDFTHDELAKLVELYFSEAMNNRRESASAMNARRSLNEKLLALSEMMWSQ